MALAVPSRVSGLLCFLGFFFSLKTVFDFSLLSKATSASGDTAAAKLQNSTVAKAVVLLRKPCPVLINVTMLNKWCACLRVPC